MKGKPAAVMAPGLAPPHSVAGVESCRRRLARGFSRPPQRKAATVPGAQVCVAFLALWAGSGLGWTQEALPELRTAEAVRRLTAEQAERGYPVRLRGVVSFFNQTLFSRFVQDDTAGI